LQRYAVAQFFAIFKGSPVGDSAAQKIVRSPAASMTGNAVLPAFLGEIAMKTIVSALIALSVLAGIAAPANALDAKAFYEQQDRQSH
jgi:hypothetical protein